MASMGEFQGESHCRPKRIQRLVSHLSKSILIIPYTFWQIFCKLMRKTIVSVSEDVTHAHRSVRSENANMGCFYFKCLVTIVFILNALMCY